jgi:formylglycine-generating enzyme required for sulfatase activity
MGNADSGPVHEVTLSAFFIDRTEVTVGAYAACVGARRCAAAATDEDANSMSPTNCNGQRQDRWEHPVNCVSWSEANAYCQWRDARLPTEAEWEYAARGTDGRTYPWGEQAPSDQLLRWSGGCGRPGCLRPTAPVGSHPAGASPFGVPDMEGNVSEYVSDWYGPYPAGPSTNPRGPDHSPAPYYDVHVLRGSAWTDFEPASVRAALRRYTSPGLRNSMQGFRCARGGS